MKKDIRSYGYTELKKEMEHLGEKAFRAKQVYEWLHVGQFRRDDKSVAETSGADEGRV